MSRLDEIRERCDRATPGPWISDNYGRFVQAGYGSWHTVCECPTFNKSGRDAEFIACAREDIPFLLAEVDRLTKEREAALARCQEALREGRVVVLPDKLIAPYKLNDRYWVTGWDSDYCTMTIQDQKCFKEKEGRTPLRARSDGYKRRVKPSKPFANGTEADLFNATFCCRCSEYRMDDKGMPLTDNCEIDNKLAKAMFDDSAWPGDKIVEVNGCRACTLFHCDDAELMKKYHALFE